MKKTLLAIVCAISVIGCTTDTTKSFDAATAAGGGLSKLPSPPDDDVSSDKTDVPERDLSVYKPGVFTLPKSAAKSIRSKPVARHKTTPIAKKKEETKQTKAQVKTVAKNKKASKQVAKKTKLKSKNTAKKVTSKKVTAKKVKKTKSKAKH